VLYSAIFMNSKKWIKGKGYFKKILFSKRDIKGKIDTIQIVKFNPGKESPFHFHKKTREIFYILKGQAILIIESKRFRTNPGEIFICEPKEIHRVVNNTKEEFIILVFKINSSEKDIYWIKRYYESNNRNYQNEKKRQGIPSKTYSKRGNRGDN